MVGGRFQRVTGERKHGPAAKDVLESECFGGVGSLQIIGCCACERERCLIRKSGVVARGGSSTAGARGMEDRCSQLCGYSCGRESVSQRCDVRPCNN